MRSPVSITPCATSSVRSAASTLFLRQSSSPVVDAGDPLMFPKRVVLMALLGEHACPRGPAAWTTTSPTQILYAARIRSNPDHLLHSSVRPATCALISTLHDRQPFCNEETVHLLRRAESQCHVPLFLRERIQGDDRDELPGMSGQASRRRMLGELLTECASAAPAQWYSLGCRTLGYATSESGGEIQRRQAWEDMLYRFADNPVWTQGGMHHAVHTALEALKSLVTVETERVAQRLTAIRSSDDVPAAGIVPPRWLRKLRKLITEQPVTASTASHAVNSAAHSLLPPSNPPTPLMMFSRFLEDVIAAEESLPTVGAHQATELLRDVELLLFHVSVPSRRDGVACLDRALIAPWTLQHLAFSLPRLWSNVLSCNGTAVRSDIQRVLQCAANAVVYAKNDDEEVLRLLPMIRVASEALANYSRRQEMEPALRVVSAHILRDVILPSLLEAVRLKCQTLQFMNAKSVVEMAILRQVVLQRLHDAEHDTPDGISIPAISMLLETIETEKLQLLPHRLWSIVHDVVGPLLVQLAVSVRVPKVLDRLVKDVTATVDSSLMRWGLKCTHAHTMVVSAARQSPLDGSVWKGTMVRMPSWTCGCGDEVAAASHACPRCTLTLAPHGSFAQHSVYTCPSCSVVTGALRGSCHECGTFHPTLALSTTSKAWYCHRCDGENDIARLQCNHCGEGRLISPSVCGACEHENVSGRHSCSRCGNLLMKRDADATNSSGSPSSVNVLFWICHECGSLDEVASPAAETPACRNCMTTARRRTTFDANTSVTTHHFQWCCGCGQRNSPSMLRCWSCSGNPEHQQPLSLAQPSCNDQYTCTKCHAHQYVGHTQKQKRSGGQRYSLPSLAPKPLVMSVTTCGACTALHPRDEAIVHTRRLTVCEHCDHLMTVQDTSCPRCHHPASRASHLVAVLDLPWMCHACGSVNTVTEGGGSGAAHVCSTCLVDRPSSVLFHPVLPWSCSVCHESRCSGFLCDRCGHPNAHLPTRELFLWRCDCTSWNFSFERACSKCSCSKTTTSWIAPARNNFPFTTWQCRRCKADNGPKRTACHQCHLHQPSMDITQEDESVRLAKARTLLLEAASQCRGTDETSRNEELVQSLMPNHRGDEEFLMSDFASWVH